MVRIEGRTWLLWAAWILLLPAKWIICSTVAALVHEAFHLISIFVVGGKVRSITIGPSGVIIEAIEISGYREVICALAGPAGSFFLAGMIPRFPLLGFCGLVQGLFNLLPIYPLDGGRAMKCLQSIVRK